MAACVLSSVFQWSSAAGGGSYNTRGIWVCGGWVEGGGVWGGEVHSRYVGMQYFTRGRARP